MSDEVDGKDYIRIHTKGVTELGRLLSEYSDTYIETRWGKFRTIAGLSAFLRTGCNNPEIYKAMNRMQVIAHMKTASTVPNPNYNRSMKAALHSYVIRNERLKELLVGSELPFRDGSQYYIDYYEKLREKLRG